MDAPHARSLLVALHAPTAADPDRDSWWRALRHLLAGFASCGPLVLAEDWNVRFWLPRRAGVAGDYGGAY